MMALAAGLAWAPYSALAACVGGAPNGALQGGEDCDDGTLPSDCCSDTCTFIAQGTLCDDFNDCSKSTKCDGSGECGGGTNNPGTCRKRDDETGAPVNCIVYTCAGKACDASQPVMDICDDMNPCSEDICLDPATDSCDPIHPPIPAGSPCNSDNDACTIEECDAGGVCVYDSTISCPDSNPLDCVDRLCDIETGSCVNVDEAKGKTCTSDNNTCTQDECNARGDCKHYKLPAGTPCDDGNFCTGGEQCNATKVCGGGTFAGVPINENQACNDTNICTDSLCLSGACTATACRVGGCPACSSTCNTTLPGCGCSLNSGG
jgi:hypothetical protein